MPPNQVTNLLSVRVWPGAAGRGEANRFEHNRAAPAREGTARRCSNDGARRRRYGFGVAAFPGGGSSAGAATGLNESSAVVLKSWYWFTRLEA
jgi:hypothetical protein